MKQARRLILWAEDDKDQFDLASRAVETALAEKGIAVSFENALDGSHLFTQLSLSTQPDVLVLDVDIEPPGGLDLVPEVAKRWPGLPIIIVSGHINDRNVRPVLEEMVKQQLIRSFHGPREYEEYSSSILSAIVRRPPSILHISDLHFGKAHAFPHSQLDELFCGLSEQISVDGRIDIVVASGDFACLGNEEEFALAKSFLRSALLALGLTASQLVIVPGNHDIDRKAARTKRFSNYIDFMLDLYGELPTPNDIYKCYPELFDAGRQIIRGTARTGTGEEVYSIVIFDEIRTIVVGLNSVCSEDAEFDFGRISANQFIKLRRHLNSISINRTDYFKVAVFHHNLFVVPSFRTDGEPERIVRNPSFVLQQLIELGFEMVLHGHTHYSAAHKYEPVDLEKAHAAKSLLVVGTGTLGGQHREPSQPFGHAVTFRANCKDNQRISAAALTLFQLWDSSIDWRRGPTKTVNFVA